MVDFPFTLSSTVDDIQYDDEDEEEEDGVMMNSPKKPSHFTLSLNKKISTLLKLGDTRSGVYTITGFRYLKREELP